MPEEKSNDGQKKRLYAAALKYKLHEDAAPKLIAKGKGLIAEKILEIAREHNIPVKEDPELIQALMKLELNQFIPPELYQVVAEIMAFIYRMNDKFRQTQTAKE